MARERPRSVGRILRPDVDPAAEAAVAGEIPDHRRAMETGRIERSRVSAERDAGDEPGATLDRLAGRGTTNVPDDRPSVLTGGDRHAPVAAEVRRQHPSVMTLRGKARA